MSVDSMVSFTPDYATPPGDTLLEFIESLGISQSELADRTGRPKKTINEIIRAKAAITPETALQLEMVLGLPAAFWTKLEQDYRTALARKEERARLQRYLEWMDQFPVKAILAHAWISPQPTKISLLEALLSFFGVASPEAWTNVWDDTRKAVAFRESPVFKSDFPAVAAWLRRGELEARLIDAKPYNAEVFRAALATIRGFTTIDPNVFFKDVRRVCAAAGVAVALVPEIPKARVCGATRWLSPEKALIQLSLRYKMHDQLWFTFFHEAGHILLHGKRSLFVESSSKARDASDEEGEADKFAQDFLVPPDAYMEFVATRRFHTLSIRNFAQTIGIAPGIVVGRLQHDGYIPFSAFTSLRQGLQWLERKPTQVP